MNELKRKQKLIKELCNSLTLFPLFTQCETTTLLVRYFFSMLTKYLKKRSRYRLPTWNFGNIILSGVSRDDLKFENAFDNLVQVEAIYRRKTNAKIYQLWPSYKYIGALGVQIWSSKNPLVTHWGPASLESWFSELAFVWNSKKFVVLGVAFSHGTQFGSSQFGSVFFWFGFYFLVFNLKAIEIKNNNNGMQILLTLNTLYVGSLKSHRSVSLYEITFIDIPK